eukprot:5774762-Pyramimonas_sp.AAC.1
MLLARVCERLCDAAVAGAARCETCSRVKAACSRLQLTKTMGVRASALGALARAFLRFGLGSGAIALGCTALGRARHQP